MMYDEIEETAVGLVFYHRTSDEGVAAILENGFKDSEGFYGMGIELKGVWISNRPLDINEGTAPGPLLRIMLRTVEAQLEEFEVINDGATYREWCLPAALLNSKATAEVIDDEDDLPDFQFPKEWFGLPTKEDKATAYHEAGHVVGEVRRGAPVAARVGKEADILGAARSPIDWHDDATARAYVTTLLAGYAVDLERGVPEAQARAQASGDFDEARPIIDALGGDEAAFVAEASRFVRDNWSAIDAVAVELLQCRELDEDETVLIVALADGDPDAQLALALVRACRNRKL